MSLLQLIAALLRALAARLDTRGSTQPHLSASSLPEQSNEALQTVKATTAAMSASTNADSSPDDQFGGLDATLENSARGGSWLHALTTLIRASLMAVATISAVVVLTYGSRVLIPRDQDRSDGFRSVFSALQTHLQRELGSTGLDLATLSFSSLVSGIGLFAVAGWASSMRSSEPIQPAEASRQFKTEELTQLLYLCGASFNILIIVTANAALPSATATTVVAVAAAAGLAFIAPTTVRRQAAQSHRDALFAVYVNRVVHAAQALRPETTAQQLIQDAAARSRSRSILVGLRHHPWISTLITAAAYTAPMYVLTLNTGAQTFFASETSGAMHYVAELAEVFLGAFLVVAIGREAGGNRTKHRPDQWSGWVTRVGVLIIIVLGLSVLVIGSALDDYPWQFVLGVIVGSLCAFVVHFGVRRNAPDVRRMEYDNLVQAVESAARRYGQHLPEADTIATRKQS